jgi:hypothetical protein
VHADDVHVGTEVLGPCSAPSATTAPLHGIDHCESARKRTALNRTDDLVSKSDGVPDRNVTVIEVDVAPAQTDERGRHGDPVVRAGVHGNVAQAELTRCV